jgi:hypothetical protein
MFRAIKQRNSTILQSEELKAYLPPDQPVLTSHPVAPWLSIFSASIAAYFVGCNIMNAAPKQAENVACGSFIPSSVPATYIKMVRII